MDTKQDQALRAMTHRGVFSIVPLLATFLFMFFCLPASADTKPQDEEGVFYKTVNGANLKFKISNSSGLYMVDVMGFATDASFNGKLTIPAKVTNDGTEYSIRAISSDSFKGTAITELVVKCCWGIFRNAFKDCKNLTSVEIEQFFNYYYGIAFSGTCPGLNEDSFAGCTSLTSFTLPQYCSNDDYVNSFLSPPFSGCTALKNITVKEDPDRVFTSGSYYKAIDGVLYEIIRSSNQNKGVLMCYPEGKTEATYNIPEGTTEIYQFAITGQPHLRKVTIPEGMLKVGGNSFWKCQNLYQVEMPETVTEIGGSAFNSCKNLKVINLPAGLKKINYRTFYYCSSLENIKLPIGLKKIEEAAFYGCTSLKSIKLPYGLTEIVDDAFSRCTSLTEVVAKNPSSPTCGNYAFRGLESQINLTVPEESDYAQWEPWSRMNITEKPLFDLLDKFGIRIDGTEVHELNYEDVFGDGKAKFSFSGKQCTLELNDIDINTDGRYALEKYDYGFTDLTVIFNGDNTLTTANCDYVWRNLAKNTDIVVNGTLTIKSPNRSIPMYMGYNTHIHGNGKLTLENKNIGFKIFGKDCSLTIDDLDISIKSGRYALFGDYDLDGETLTYYGDVTLNNVAGTITAGSAYPSVAQINSLTLNDCHIANDAIFDETQHKVESPEIVIQRDIVTPTAVAPPLDTTPSTSRSSLFDLQGRPVATPQPGHIYIIRSENGAARKVVVR